VLFALKTVSATYFHGDKCKTIEDKVALQRRRRGQLWLKIYRSKRKLEKEVREGQRKFKQES